MNRVLMKWSRELTRTNQSYELNYFSNEVEEGASRNLHRPFHASALCLVGFHLGTQSISGTLTLLSLTAYPVRLMPLQCLGYTDAISIQYCDDTSAKRHDTEAVIFKCGLEYYVVSFGCQGCLRSIAACCSLAHFPLFSRLLHRHRSLWSSAHTSDALPALSSIARHSS
jgi:hypothetical protein